MTGGLAGSPAHGRRHWAPAAHELREARAGQERSGDPGAGRAVLNRLQLLVSRRLDGLLQGDYLGLLPGAGSEAGESREYFAGDDVRRMDWPVTARTTVPHV